MDRHRHPFEGFAPFLDTALEGETCDLSRAYARRQSALAAAANLMAQACDAPNAHKEEIFRAALKPIRGLRIAMLASDLMASEVAEKLGLESVLGQENKPPPGFAEAIEVLTQERDKANANVETLLVELGQINLAHEELACSVVVERREHASNAARNETEIAALRARLDAEAGGFAEQVTALNYQRDTLDVHANELAAENTKLRADLEALTLPAPSAKPSKSKPGN